MLDITHHIGGFEAIAERVAVTPAGPVEDRAVGRMACVAHAPTHDTTRTPSAAVSRLNAA